MKKKVILASVLSIGLLGGITTLAHADETWYCDNHEGYAACGGSMQNAIHHEELNHNSGVHHDETDNTYNNTSTYYNEVHENTEHHEEEINNNSVHHDEIAGTYNSTSTHHNEVHENTEHHEEEINNGGAHHDETYNGNYAHHSETHDNTEHAHGSHHH